MAYVVVDEESLREYIFDSKPRRNELLYYGFWAGMDGEAQSVELPKGSIEKLIGKKLTWEDEPVELKEEN